jgi:hypothetical protein
MLYAEKVPEPVIDYRYHILQPAEFEER